MLAKCLISQHQEFVPSKKLKIITFATKHEMTSVISHDVIIFYIHYAMNDITWIML